jgi:glycine cleavage system H protein
MNIIQELKYSKDHEWVKFEGNTATIGITDFAQHNLGEIVYVELPKMDAELNAGDAMGVVESVKSASDIYTPVKGRVVRVNDALSDSPEKINSEPYESWIAVLQLEGGAAEDGLMRASEYEAFCKSEE